MSNSYKKNKLLPNIFNNIHLQGSKGGPRPSRGRTLIRNQVIKIYIDKWEAFEKSAQICSFVGKVDLLLRIHEIYIL